jgi:hypothetical protein
MKAHDLVALTAAFMAACCAACSRSGAADASGPCAPCQAPAAGGRLGPAQSAKMDQLARQRVELARKRLGLMRAGFDKGTVGLDALFAACRDVAFAARDSGMRGAVLRKILLEYRDAVIAMKDLTRDRVAKGAASDEALARVESLLAEAEFWLQEANEGPL